MREEDFMEGDTLCKKKFSAEEIHACAKNGDCAQCGLCCYTFVTIVPDMIPFSEDENVIAYVKSAFEFCKHLRETPEGLFQCDCHQVKGHSLLRDCAGWEGNHRRGKCSDYESIENIFQEKLMSFNQAQLLVLNRFIERGIIRFDLIAKSFTLENRKTLLVTILTDCSLIPHALLEKLGTKKSFQKFSKMAIKSFLRENNLPFQELTTKQKILLKIYLPQVYLK